MQSQSVMLKRWQIKYIFESLQREHRLKNIKPVIDKYSNGFTNDKYDPVYTKKQAFSSAFTLWDCTRLAQEKGQKIYTAGVDCGCEHLYNGRKFKNAYAELKAKAKEFEKKLKKADKNIAFFKKLEVLLNLDNALYEVHYHYIISAENEIDTNSFDNYFEPVYKDAFSTYSYFTKEWITVESKSFVTKKNLEGKLRWSALPLGKEFYGIIKDFIAKSYDSLRRQQIYKYYGDFQTYNKSKQDKIKEEKSDYVLQIINLGDSEMLPMEKMGEYQKFKQLEFMREQRKKKKKIEQVKKATGKNIDDVEIVIAPPIKPKNSIETDLDMEIPKPSKEQIKKWKEEKRMARIKAKENEHKYQLKLFRSREEIEAEERKKAKEKAKIKAEEWLDTMEDFFSPSEEEVEKVLGLRNERIARLEILRKTTTELMLRSEKKYITESRIKAIAIEILNLLRMIRLNQNICLKWLEFALELISKTRLGLSFGDFRVQERNYWECRAEKVKKVIRPPPIAKSSRFDVILRIFKKKCLNFEIYVV